MLSCPCGSELFKHRAAPGGPATVFPGGGATYGYKRLLYFEGYEDIRTAIASEKQLKESSKRMGKIASPGVLRLRATIAVSRDPSVRRSAQRL